MAIDPTSWFPEQPGAQISSSQARTLAYSATSGAEGIISSGDLHVSQLATPGTSVRVAPGAGVMLNSYQGKSTTYESYIGRNRTTTNVAITATGSAGGRTDLVVMRISDPGFAGSAPANPITYEYTRLEVIQGVSANISDINSLNLPYPAIALAKITIPKSTATITNAMISDLREVANPRQKEIVRPRPNITGDSGLLLTSRQAYPSGEWFPNVSPDGLDGQYYVDIPRWATRMQIRHEWLGVQGRPNAGYGNVWVSYGPSAGSATPAYYTQAFGFDFPTSSNTQRQNLVVHQEVSIPAEWRGSTQAFVPRANKTSPNNATYNGEIGLTALSGTVFSVRFLEYADQDLGS